MTVTAVHTDLGTLSLTLQAEFDVPVERVWQLWADPRQLERWWGPPGYPATVTGHDLRPGGRVTYFMTGPDGDRYHGYWQVEAVDAPRSLEARDGFADEDGRPNRDLPLSQLRLTIAALGERTTRMIVETTFEDLAAMEQVLAMGMQEGLTEAVGQIDAILAEEQPEPGLRLALDDATIHWDLHEATDTDRPVLIMVGYPMGAAGFASQVERFTDRTVVTYDPRGVERSTGAADGARLVEQSVTDLRALVDAVRAKLGPVAIDVLASSGGAVTALAFVAAHPDIIRTLIAHEPPTITLLEDADAASAAWMAVHDTYVRDGWGAGMAHFIAMVSHDGPFTDDWATQPAPDPAVFGMPADDDGSRDDPLLSQDDNGVSHHELDADRIAAASTRVIIAAGVDTGDALTGRTARALADAVGTDLALFPGGHTGFMGGEYGQPPEEPDAFAEALRQHLDTQTGAS